MRTIKYTYTIILISFSLSVFSQNEKFSIGMWKFNSLSGKIGLTNNYQSLKMESVLNETQNTYFVDGVIDFKTKSYIWHPSFLKIEIDAKYNPGFDNTKYVLLPDYSGLRRANRLGATATFFDKRPMSLTSFVKLSNSFYRIDELSNTRIITFNWGSILLLNNKYLPLKFSFNQIKSKNIDNFNDRENKLNRINFTASANKSFTIHDKSYISYKYINLKNEYYFGSELYNMINHITFRNIYNIDKNKKYSIHSSIDNYIQEGNSNLKRLSINENIKLILPKQFRFTGRYRYQNITFPQYLQNIQTISGDMSHKLFYSLRSSIGSSYSSNINPNFNQSTISNNINIDYTKQIPFGQFLAKYTYTRTAKTENSDQVNLIITNEEYFLSDNEITLLNRQDVISSSIVVTDITGTIVYQQGFDYDIIEVDNVIEIRRIPGGFITNQSNVYVSYVALLGGNSKYDINSHSLRLNFVLFKSFFNLYASFNNKDHINVVSENTLTLNDYTRITIGLKLKYKFFEIGAEIEKYDAVILPYNRTNYYLRLFKKIKKLSLSLNSNYTEVEFTKIDLYRNNLYVLGNIKYNITPLIISSTNIAFQYQDETYFHLNHLMAESKITATFRKLDVSFAVEKFFRSYQGINHDLSGVYLELVRKF